MRPRPTPPFWMPIWGRKWMNDTLDTVLSVEKLVAGYVKGMPIIKGIELELGRGSITVIIGPNGAGKSTLIKAIAGIIPLTSGSIKLGSYDITGMKPHEMVKHFISYIPQSDNVFKNLSVIENLELVLSQSSLNSEEKIGALFNQFPVLDEKRNEKAGTLSGGQRQILALAKALATEPQIILMDEPSAGLSPKAAKEVLELAREITLNGVSILLVEQNVKQSLALSDHCYILAEGRNQLDGKASDLLDDPIVGQIYLGGKRMVTP
jgi:branched-chain amino acid transport system ATP-binding protein